MQMLHPLRHLHQPQATQTTVGNVPVVGSNASPRTASIGGSASGKNGTRYLTRCLSMLCDVQHRELPTDLYTSIGDRKVITRTDLGEHLLVFYQENIHPMHLCVEEVLWYMISSGEYVPDHSWLTPAPGHGVDLPKIRAFLKCVRHPALTSLNDVATLFLEANPDRVKHMLREEYGYEFGGEDGYDHLCPEHRQARARENEDNSNEDSEEHPWMPWHDSYGKITRHGVRVMNWPRAQRAVARARGDHTVSPGSPSTE